MGFFGKLSKLVSGLTSGTSAPKGASQGQAYQKKAESKAREYTSQAQAYQSKAESKTREYTSQARTQTKSEAPRYEEPKSAPKQSIASKFWSKVSSFVAPNTAGRREKDVSREAEQVKAFNDALDKMEEEYRQKSQAPSKPVEIDPFEIDASPSEPPSPPGGSPPSTPRNYGGGGFGGSEDEWLHSGTMKLIENSTNVYGISYDLQNQALFIQFKHWEPGMDWMEHSGPGSVYRYDDIDESEALEFYRSASKGCWIWDRLRVHASWGHQREYELVRVPSSYVPREAVDAGEHGWWVSRSSLAGSSTLESAPAIPIQLFAYWRKQHEARKRRATPDRGTPERGKPRSFRPNNGRP